MKAPSAVAAMGNRLTLAVAEWIVGHPKKSILLSLLVVLLSAAGLAGYRYSLDHRVFFGQDNPQLIAFEKLQRDYSKTDVVLMALAPKSGNVFTPDFLAVVSDLTQRSWKVPYSQRVESLTNFQHVVVDGDNISTADLVSAPQQLDKQQLAKIRQVATGEPFLVNSLVNPEGSVTAVRITLNMPGKDQLHEIPLVVDQVRALAAEIEKTHPDIAVRLAGQTIANKAFPEESQADFVRVWPWFALTMMVLLTVIFRSWQAMLVTFTTCVLAVLGGAGAVGFFHPVINDAVIVSPIMILSMAFADAIHLVVNWIQGLLAGRDKRTAMADSLKSNMGAMMVTSIMTAVGFLTLLFNDSPPFQVMGVIVSAGVVYVLFLTFFFTAPLLIVLPGKPPRKVSALMNEDSPQMERFASFVIRHRHPILATVLIGAGALTAFATKNVINDDVVKYYTPGAKFRQDVEFVNTHLTGISEVNYSLPAAGKDSITDPAYLRKVDEFASWLKTQQDVTQVNSLADIIKRVNQTLHGDDQAYYRIPDSREEVAQYLLQYEMSLPYGMDLNYLLRFDRSESRVRVAVGTSSGQRLIAVDAAAATWLKQHAPAAMQAQGTSLSLMFAHIGERSISGMFSGMLGSLAAESLFVMLAFGAIGLGLVSFTGNLIPIGMAFGAWGLLNGNIDVGLTMVLGIAFSVVVDDTIHFISKYKRGRASGLSPEDSVRYAFRYVGFAILTTTLVLGLGYAWLANSAIQLTVNTALVTTTTIALALVVDLLLIPVLFLLVDKDKPAAQQQPDASPIGGKTAPAAKS